MREPANPALTVTLIGSVVRETRTRLRWTQRELGRRSGAPQSLISTIERGIATDLRLSDVDRILRALGVRYRLALDPPAIEPRHQVDLVHARCVSHVVRRLMTTGWEIAREVEIGGDRSRGWIDLLAWRPDRRTLLVIEVKTEILDIGAIERQLNWYEREAWAAARRLGWHARHIGATLLVLQSDANDRAISANRDGMAAAFPIRATALSNALRHGEPPDRRALAMIDPRSHRAAWLRPARADGRRSPAPYVDYIDAVRMIESKPGRRVPSRRSPCRSKERQMGVAYDEKTPIPLERGHDRARSSGD